MSKAPVLLVLIISVMLQACSQKAADEKINPSAPWMQDKAMALHLLDREKLKRMQALADQGKSEEAKEIQKQIDIKKVHELLNSSVEKLSREKVTNTEDMKREIKGLLAVYSVVVAFEFSEIYAKPDEDKLKWYSDTVTNSENILHAAQRHLGKEDKELIAYEKSIDDLKAGTKAIEDRVKKAKLKK